MSELKSYGKALRQDDKIAYESVLKQAFKHYGTISYASSIHAWAFLLLSIILEQEKRLRVVEDVAYGRLQGRKSNSSVDEEQ